LGPDGRGDPVRVDEDESDDLVRVRVHPLFHGREVARERSCVEEETTGRSQKDPELTLVDADGIVGKDTNLVWQRCRAFSFMWPWTCNILIPLFNCVSTV
jgi:hypothetical protein